MNHVYVTYPEPHLDRMRKILAAHPEVKNLTGYTPTTSVYVFIIVALQIMLCFAMQSLPMWGVFLAAYTIGAVANHALWVLIHECTHNLIFKTSLANSWLQIFANLPIIFPTAMSFRMFHIKHHLHQGDFDRDADLPRPAEARLVGNSALGKSLWLLFFFVSQLARVPSIKGIEVINRWVLANWIIELTFLASITWFAGPNALIYLALCSIFSIGLHPLGARWIQEHYIVHEKQETYSYYGPLNKIAFNVGFHNEHHDFMGVPWSRLPKLRAIAPEFYDSLYWHKSWTQLLIRFLFDPKMSLFSRVIRGKSAAQEAIHQGTLATESAPANADGLTRSAAPKNSVQVEA